MILAADVTIDGVDCNIEGIFSRVRNLKLQNSASLTLSALGRSLGFSSSVYNLDSIELQSNSQILIIGGFILFYASLTPPDTTLQKGASIYVKKNVTLQFGTRISTLGFGPSLGPGAGGSASYIHTFLDLIYDYLT